MRSVYVPVAAVEAVPMAIGELPAPPGGGVMGEGNEKLTPAGELPTQEAEKVIGWLKPPIDATIIVVAPLRPRVMDIEVEDAVTVKSGSALDVTVVVVAEVVTTFTSTEWLNVPLVPVTLMMKEPVEAPAPALIVRAEVAVPLAVGVTGLGRSKLVPDGAVPTQDPASPTWLLKPSNEVTIIVAVPLEPGLTEIKFGEEETAKSAAPGDKTVSVRLTE